MCYKHVKYNCVPQSHLPLQVFESSKLAFWDKTGFTLWYNRLEKQKFKWPNKAILQKFELSPEQLDWLLSGYDVLDHVELQYQPMI